MKRVFNLRKNQAGQALIIVTIVLALAAIVIPTSLSLTYSGHRETEISKQETMQFYAADTGVEDAMYLIQQGSSYLPQTPGASHENNLNVNGYDVAVTISREARSYEITSIATDPIDNSQTKVTSTVPLCVLTINPTTGGDTDPPAGDHTYLKDTEVDLVATPDTGYNFVDWTGNVTNRYSALTTIVMDNDYTIQANFEEEGEDYWLCILVYPEGAGTTTPAPNAYHWYDDGTEVHLVATPAECREFTGWTGDTGTIDETSSPDTTITMYGNYTLTANFQVRTQTLNISSTAGGSVTTPGEGSFQRLCGTVQNLVAVAEEDYEFTGWTGGPVADPDSATTTITMNDDYSIVANFIKDPGYPCIRHAIASTGIEDLDIMKTVHFDFSADGDVYANSNIIVDMNTIITGNVYSTGNVILKTNAEIRGNVQAKGYIKMGKFSIIDGNAYAGVNLGDAYIQVGQDALITGDATSSGAITIDRDGQIYGTQYPNSPGLIPPFPPLNEPDWGQIAQDYKVVAQSGGTYSGDYEITNGGTESLGPLYITGDLILNNNVTLTLTEIVYVDGQVTVGTNCQIIGPGFLIAEGDITMWSNDGVPGDSLPVIMSIYGDIYCKNGGIYRAVLYAPNGRITLEEGASLYGAAMGESISTNNGFSATYASELDDMMDCP